MQKRLKKKSLENAMEVTCKQKWANIRSNIVQNTMVITCMQKRIEIKSVYQFPIPRAYDTVLRLATPGTDCQGITLRGVICSSVTT